MGGSRYEQLRDLLKDAQEADDPDPIDIIKPELEQLESEEDDD